MKPLGGVRTTGEPYVRPAVVEAEIEAVLEWPLHKAFALAVEGRLRPQTLVYLMRNCRPNRPTPQYDALVVAFYSRLERSGREMTKGLSDLEREWVDGRVKDKAIERVAKDRLDIFEMSFKRGAERLYQDALAALRLRARTEVSREDLVEPGSGATGEEVADALGFVRNGSMPLAEARAMLNPILKRLSEKERLAAVYVLGMGMTEKEAGAQMGCSDRNIRYLLEKLREKAGGNVKQRARGNGAQGKVRS